MADIAVRKGNGQQQVVPSLLPRDWDPFRTIRSLIAWDPFREMAPILPTLPIEERIAAFSPAFEVKETNDSFVFKADVPGVKQEDLDVTVTGDRLCVAGKREAEGEEKGDRFYSHERSYGSFTRAFTLPVGADPEHVHAELKEGVLSLVVPKKPGAQPKKIAIKAGEKARA